jgi:antitoxin component of MazEF toxin-antitoxin module
MIKTLIKVGNSHAVVLDRSLLNLVGLREGDKVDGDSIILTRVGHTASDDQLEQPVLSTASGEADKRVIGRFVHRHTRPIT